MQWREDTTFIYLKFAAMNSLPYEQVLAAADAAMQMGDRYGAVVKLTPDWPEHRRLDLMQLVNDERKRREKERAKQDALPPITYPAVKSEAQADLERQYCESICSPSIYTQHTLGLAINEALRNDPDVVISEGSFEARPETVDRYGSAMLAAMSKVPHPQVYDDGAHPLRDAAKPMIPVLDAYPAGRSKAQDETLTSVMAKRAATFDDWYFGSRRKA